MLELSELSYEEWGEEGREKKRGGRRRGKGEEEGREKRKRGGERGFVIF